MDEVFGAKNLVSQISFRKTGGEGASQLGTICDFILWYARDSEKLKFRPLFVEKSPGDDGAVEYTNVELKDGSIRSLSDEELANPTLVPLFPVAHGYSLPGQSYLLHLQGKIRLLLRFAIREKCWNSNVRPTSTGPLGSQEPKGYGTSAGCSRGRVCVSLSATCLISRSRPYLTSGWIHEAQSGRSM